MPLNGAIAKAKANELLENLHREKVPAGLIRNIRDVMEDIDIQDIIIEAGDVRGIRSYVGQTGDPISNHLKPPPHLGEHSRAILEALLKFSPTAVPNRSNRRYPITSKAHFSGQKAGFYVLFLPFWPKMQKSGSKWLKVVQIYYVCLGGLA